MLMGCSHCLPNYRVGCLWNGWLQKPCLTGSILTRAMCKHTRTSQKNQNDREINTCSILKTNVLLSTSRVRSLLGHLGMQKQMNRFPSCSFAHMVLFYCYLVAFIWGCLVSCWKIIGRQASISCPVYREEIHPAVKKICAKKLHAKKITLGFLHALPQTLALQLSTWDELEIFCLPLVELIRAYSTNIFSD